jgi:hypothetical protein
VQRLVPQVPEIYKIVVHFDLVQLQVHPNL